MQIPQVGETFGPYYLQGVLGRGGMGVVFVADQVALSRPVALKVLLPQFAESDDYRRRFAREAAALASAQSPHIVPIFDYGEIDGALFLATQLVPGSDLGRRVKGAPLDVATAIRVARDICRGLDDAHNVGVLHRDVKPSNVLIWDRPEGPHAYLCDFGIAKVQDSTETTTDGTVGTWAFLAPERCKGAPASEASDIYAAGCLLWNMLTGAVPFGGTAVETAMAHVNAPPPQLTDRTGVADALNEILSTSMAKDPRDRFASARAMADALSKAEVLIPTQAVGDATLGDTQHLGPALDEPHHRPSRTLRAAMVTLSVAAALALVAALGVSQGWWSLGQDDDESKQASADSTGSTDPNASEAATCWNGVSAQRLNDCPNPSGREGLAWAIPSLDLKDPACSDVPKAAADKELVIVCQYRFGRATGLIRYSAWTTARQAQSHYLSSYPDPPEQVESRQTAPRMVWRLPGRTQNGLYRMSSAYLDWPFSVSVEASTKVGREAGYRQVVFRPTEEMIGTTQGSS